MEITIGKNALTKRAYAIDPARHITLIGATGVGKSSTLEHLFVEFLKQGNGGLFIDVHGDVYDRLLRLLPYARHRDIVLLDPDADSVPCFNPLFFQDPDQLEQAKETCLTLLKSLSGSDSAWGNETPYNLRMGLDAITETVQQPTLVHLHRFISDDEYRNSLLSKSKNPFLTLYKTALNKLSLRDQAAKLAPALNKIAKLMRPNVLPFIAGERPLDPLDLMNQKKIVLCRFSKGRIGEETAMILYSLIVSLFAIAAMKREKQTERPPFIIVADEAQNALHGGKFGSLLAEARKYAISLVTAFQGSYQMPIMDDILTNAGTQIIFNASGEDADRLSSNWKNEKVIAAQITDLGRYEFYARTFRDNQPIVDKVKALAPLKIHRPEENKLAKISQENYGVPKTKTQEKILKTFSA